MTWNQQASETETDVAGQSLLSEWDCVEPVDNPPPTSLYEKLESSFSCLIEPTIGGTGSWKYLNLNF